MRLGGAGARDWAGSWVGVGLSLGWGLKFGACMFLYAGEKKK